MVILQKKHLKRDFPNLTNYTKYLPPNYNFEIEKSLNSILNKNYKKIAIQMPDGLLKYSLIINDIIKRFTGADCIILGDVVYGACCVDDNSAYLFGCDLLIHYGHSCLIPINECKVKCMYVFVDIFFDSSHCEEMIKKIVKEERENNNKIKNCKENIEEENKNDTKECCLHEIENLNINDITKKEKNINFEYLENDFTEDSNCCKTKKNSFASNTSIKEEIYINLKEDLLIKCDFTNLNKEEKVNDIISSYVENYKDIAILGTIQFNTVINTMSKKLKLNLSQIKPLSKGEVLGCTSPKLNNIKILFYISDGRFHLESIMINNPDVIYYKYCPFSKKMSREFFNFKKMLSNRKIAKENAFKGKIIGVILGTLGRQGNPLVHDKVCKFLKSKGFLVVNLMLKEINENLLEDFEFIDAFVQISCPRLSTDWGCNYKKPILNSYEVFNDLNTYELDYYARETKKEWNNY